MIVWLKMDAIRARLGLPMFRGRTGPYNRPVAVDGPLRADIPLPRWAWRMWLPQAPRPLPIPDAEQVPLPLLGTMFDNQ